MVEALSTTVSRQMAGTNRDAVWQELYRYQVETGKAETVSSPFSEQNTVHVRGSAPSTGKAAHGCGLAETNDFM